MSTSAKYISEIHHRAEIYRGSAGFGIVTYRKGGRHGPRWQSYGQLVILHRGSVTILIDGRTYVLRAGMGILLEPGHVVELQFSKQVEARHSWTQLTPEDLPEKMIFPSYAYHQPAKCSDQTMALIRLGLQARSFAPWDTTENRPMTSLVIAAIWAFVADIRTIRMVPGPELSALGKFQAAMGALGAEKVTLADLALQSGVSRGHLTKLVRDRLGVTPMEMVWRARVTRGAKLLQETGLSVSEVAEQSGFANAYHFSRRFRQQFGQSPRQWRTVRREVGSSSKRQEDRK